MNGRPKDLGPSASLVKIHTVNIETLRAIAIVPDKLGRPPLN